MEHKKTKRILKETRGGNALSLVVKKQIMKLKLLLFVFVSNGWK
jgi:hypothetical protein